MGTQAEELYRSVVELSPDSIITVDTKGVITSCNTSATRMLGYSEDEMVGKHFSKLGVLRARDLPKYLKLFVSALRGKLTKPLELTFQRKDGTIFLAEVRVGLLKEGDKTIGIQAISRDIIERKKTEEALKESEQKLRNIIDTSPDAIVWTDIAGNITLVNRKGFELTGFSEKDLVGKNFMDVEALTQESKERILESFVKRIEGINTPPYEVEVVAKNGEIIPAELSASPICEGDKIVGTQSIFRDLRERKKMEEKLRHYSENLEELVQKRTEELLESEKRYSVLVEEASDGVAILQDEKIVFSNKKVTEITGYSRDELVGLPFQRIVKLVVEKDRQSVKERHASRLRGEAVPVTQEIEIICKTGESVPIEITGTFIHYQGRPAILTIVRDIRERKRMEEQRLRLERLAAIGEVATMVGHDLRNPLQSIENATYYLNNELQRLRHASAIPQKAIEILRAISDSVEYADIMVRDLQDFSTPKKSILKNVDVNAIVEKTLTQVVHAQAARENVEVVTKLGHLPKIKADKDQIKRVFLNLAVNAMHAMENGGTLKVSSEKTRGFVEVSFKDTGVGISKQNMKKLFTPFFTTKARGLGMGLPICKKFVDAHGGSIKVESEEGKGSTFTVKLPIQQRMEVKKLDEE